MIEDIRRILETILSLLTIVLGLGWFDVLAGN